MTVRRVWGQGLWISACGIISAGRVLLPILGSGSVPRLCRLGYPLPPPWESLAFMRVSAIANAQNAGESLFSMTYGYNPDNTAVSSGLGAGGCCLRLDHVQ